MGALIGNELGLFILLGCVLTLVVLFLILAIIGLIRIRKSCSQGFIIAGFIGLATSLILVSHLGCEIFNRTWIDGILNFEQRSQWIPILQWLPLSLPCLIFFCLWLLGQAGRKHASTALFSNLGCLGTIAALMMFLFMSNVDKWPGPGGNGRVIDQAREIQYVLEKYAEDHDGHYPDSVYDLLGDYIVYLKFNAFTTYPIKNVAYGASDVEGNFTYFPITINNNIYGYYLLSYGAGDDPGIRLVSDNMDDHVIQILSSPEDNPAWPPDTPFPSVNDVIISSRQ